MFQMLVDFVSAHSHCTVYKGLGLGPATYIADAGDLTTVLPSNQLVKFAHDTY